MIGLLNLQVENRIPFTGVFHHGLKLSTVTLCRMDMERVVNPPSNGLIAIKPRTHNNDFYQDISLKMLSLTMLYALSQAFE